MEIGLRKNTDFKNEYYTEKGSRQTKIPMTSFYKLRVWKEYFFRFRDSVYDQNYVLDC